MITGRIYFIKSKQTNNLYIGSTKQTLIKRFQGHKYDYNNFINKNGFYVSSFEILKYDDCYIELIKEVVCTKHKLLELEGEEINKNENCINIEIAGNYVKCKNKKEYLHNFYEKNKEYYLNYSKEYKQNNKEKMQEYRNSDIFKKNEKEYNKKYNQEHKLTIRENQKEKDKETHICNCGGKFKSSGYWNHIKTIKHKDYYKK